MTESPEIRLKRLKIRSWRRGTKEMDMILGPFFDQNGPNLSNSDLDAYEDLLNENDQDLYVWVSGQADTPAEHVNIINTIRDFAKN